jgi:hypothetical protein
VFARSALGVCIMQIVAGEVRVVLQGVEVLVAEAPETPE